MEAKFSDLVGKTLIKVEGAVKYGDDITFIASTGEVYRMYHEQNCCEAVSIEDISGDIDDLVDSEILIASEESSGNNPCDDSDGESKTWTFYRIGTIKGAVVLRWLGTSNGYYSESVDFERVEQ